MESLGFGFTLSLYLYVWLAEWWYSADILSEAFDCGDMEYFAGIKLFNKVIDRLGVDMDQQKRYEVFDHIYEAGMREKKGERNRNSR